MNKMTVAQIQANTALVASTGATWNQLVQDTAIACMYHAQDHDDSTLAQILCMAIPAMEKRSQVRAQLVSWFLAYSPVVVKNDPEWNGKISKSGKVAERGYRIDEASKNPWYLHGDKKSEDKEALTLAQLIEGYKAYAKRIDKYIENKAIAETDVLAARLFATHIRGVDLPDFKIEAYMAKQKAEQATTKGETIDPVEKPSSPAAPEAKAA